VAEFRNRFGFDWLQNEASRSPAQERSNPPPAPRALQQALIAHGQRVLKALEESPNRTAQSLELARKLNVRFDVLMSVLEYLVAEGYVERVSTDQIGNDTVKLTPAGAALLG